MKQVFPVCVFMCAGAYVGANLFACAYVYMESHKQIQESQFRCSSSFFPLCLLFQTGLLTALKPTSRPGFLAL